MKYFLLNYIKGILYGVFSVIPGLSGGILASNFGDYEQIIKIISNRDLSTYNVKYIFSILCGILSGISFMSRFILIFYQNFNFLFLIFILLFNVYVILKFHYKNNLNLLILFIVIIACFIIVFFVSRMTISIYMTSNCFQIFLYSLIFASSKILPGISSTSILINMKFYEQIMSFFSKPIDSFASAPFFWWTFWILFIIYSLVLIKIVDKLINNNFFNIFIYIITIFNTVIFLLNI